MPRSHGGYMPLYSQLPWAIRHPLLLFSLCSSNTIFLCVPSTRSDGDGFLPLLVFECLITPRSSPHLAPLFNLSLHLKTVSWFCVSLRRWHTNPLPIFSTELFSLFILIHNCRNSLFIRAKRGKLFSIKGQTVNIFGFVCHMVSAATAQVCHHMVKTAPNKMQTDGCTNRSKKLSL